MVSCQAQPAFVTGVPRCGESWDVVAEKGRGTNMINDNELLFHYTSVDGLISILKDTKIRATAASHLNDKSEMKVFSSLFSAISDISGIDAERISARSRILSQYIFVFCLSAEGNILEQWRAYCPQGGFSIGFDRVQLRELAQNISGSLVKCRYLDPITDLTPKALKGILKDTLHFGEDECNEEFDHQISEHLKDVKEDIKLVEEVSVMLEHASRFKHRAFDKECEWRIRKFQPENASKEVIYRNGSFGLTPYMEFGFAKGFIKKIYIGPRMETEFAESTLQSFLDSNDYSDIEIAVSQIPFR